MSHRRNHFRQRDVTRLLRAFSAAGCAQPSVKITTRGDLIAVPSHPLQVEDNGAANPWDEVLSDDADQKRPS
jgi:hypothetical protein